MNVDPHVTRILDSARIKLPGATDGVMRLELMNVVEDFCRRTNCWTGETCVTFNTCETEYEIFSPDANGDLYRLMWIEPICPTDPKFRSHAWMPVPGTLKISFPPSTEQSFKAIVALSPSELGKTQNFPGVPDWFWSEYPQAISAGLVGHMMAYPAKPYSSAQLARLHLMDYESKLQRARIETYHGRVYGGQRWMYPQDFAVRRRKY